MTVYMIMSESLLGSDKDLLIVVIRQAQRAFK